jgi:hypothetical protein
MTTPVELSTVPLFEQTLGQQLPVRTGHRVCEQSSHRDPIDHLFSVFLQILFYENSP